MGPVGNYIILGAAGILFVLSAVSAIQTFFFSHYQKKWLFLALAALGLAGAAGIRIYLTIPPASEDPFELVNAILILIAALLAFTGIYTIGRQSLSEAQSRKAAQTEAEQFRTSFDKSPQIVVIKDRQGEYLYTNPAYNQFLGKKDLDLAGESDAKFFPRLQANAFRQEEEKAIESGAARTRDEEIHGIEGERWMRTTRIPLFDDRKVVTGILVFAQDVTESKKAEEALLGLQQDLQALYDAETAFGEPAGLPETLECVLSGAEKIAGTPQSGLWKILPDQSVAILKAGHAKLKPLADVQVKVGEDIVWKAWQSGRVEIIEDYQTWQNRGQWARRTDFSIAIGLPLKIKSQVAYVLTLFPEDAALPDNPQRIQMLSLYAQFASAVLQAAERATSNQAEIEEWKRKSEQTQYRQRLEHILAVLAVHFINIDFAKIDEGIVRTLQTVARYAGVDRCSLTLFAQADRPEFSVPTRYSSWKSDPEEVEEFIPGEEFQSKLNQFETIHAPRLKDMSVTDEMAAYLLARGVKSFTAIPLASNRLLIGYLGLETTQVELEWSPEILSLLKTSGDLFVNLLERKTAVKRESEARQKISSQVQNLELRSQENALMTEMADLLQACRTADEAYPIIIRFTQRLMPGVSGALYMIHDAKDPAEMVAGWGKDQPSPVEHELILNECWSLRRGRIYTVEDPSTEPVCGHIKEPIHSGYMCVPLVAQGVAVGILHLRFPQNRSEKLKFTENQQQLALKIGEYIAVPLTNLKLRDELRSQAICDPLTKLYNRRYMEETLEREIRRANRHSTSVGIIMFDIDKMKPINDRFGHDAGDLVLKTLGRELLGLFRGEDVACRYGGDEFTIVLPEASLADVWRRAEQLRETIKRIDLKYEGSQLGPLTLSIGVAAYPDHGLTAERVLLASDAASYASKSEGGDRIMMGHKVE